MELLDPWMRSIGVWTEHIEVRLFGKKSNF